MEKCPVCGSEQFTIHGFAQCHNYDCERNKKKRSRLGKMCDCDKEIARLKEENKRHYKMIGSQGKYNDMLKEEIESLKQLCGELREAVRKLEHLMVQEVANHEQLSIDSREFAEQAIKKAEVLGEIL